MNDDRKGMEWIEYSDAGDYGVQDDTPYGYAPGNTCEVMKE